MNNKSYVSKAIQDEAKSYISFPDPLPKENIGSLLKVFSSPYFTLDMAVIYLYNKRKVPGVHDYLVNKLYTYSDNEIEFYIPQLSYLLVRSHSPTLEKFLLDKCTSSITLFLKIYWCFLSYGQAERKKKERYEYVEALLKKADLALVHGNLDKVSISPERSIRPSEVGHTDRTEMMKAEYRRQKLKSDYLAYTYKFINILTSVSLKLKTIKTEERKSKLKEYVKRVDKWMQTLRRKHSGDKEEYFRKLFYGIHIPFTTAPDDNSTMIVNILENEVTCFNTKKRAPYRIVVETIDMDEIGSASLNLKSNRGYSSITSSASKLDRSIASDLDISMSMEEDTFQDLIEEQEKEKDQKTNQVKEEEAGKNDKFRGLADFENFIKEEEEKAREGNIIVSEELNQINEFFKKGSHSDGVQRRYQSPVRNQNLDFDDDRKSSLMTAQGPLTQMRKSLAEKRPGHFVRSNSQENLTKEGVAKYMETFENQYAPDSIRNQVDGVIEELKHEANEEFAEGLEPKTLDDDAKKEEEPQITGWGPWDELWENKKVLIRQQSAFGHYQSYKLRCIIVKANDDLRQELIAMQVMMKFQDIWKEAGLSLKVRTYDILVTSEDSGIIEFVPDSISIDGLKKKYPGKSILQFFKDTYGYDFEEAQKNFIDSLAAYCLICFFLQIKDRHNGNILLDAYGHIVHIDFGFILCTSPGGINFESAPFKLTHEYGEMMGGPNSNTFMYFKLQVTKGFMELRKHVESLVYLIQIMMKGSDLSCFEKFDVQEFRERFKERSTDTEAVEYVSRLVDQSYDNWRTIQYDNFQKYTNGVMP